MFTVGRADIQTNMLLYIVINIIIGASIKKWDIQRVWWTLLGLAKVSGEVIISEPNIVGPVRSIAIKG